MLWRSLGSDTRSHSFEKCSMASSDSRTLLPSLVRPEPFSPLGCANWRTSAWSSAGDTALTRRATSIGSPKQGGTCFLYSSHSKSGATRIVGTTCRRWCFSMFAEQNFIQRLSARPAGSRCDSTTSALLVAPTLLCSLLRLERLIVVVRGETVSIRWAVRHRGAGPTPFSAGVAPIALVICHQVPTTHHYHRRRRIGLRSH